MDRRDELLALVNAGWTTQVVRTACVLGLPERLAGNGANVARLATDAGCHAPSLRRLLRAMEALDLCAEAADDQFVLSPLGELLCDGHPQSLRAWALLVGGPHWSRWGELDESVRSGLSHKQRHRGEQGFGDLEADPAAAATFHRAMVQMTRGVADAIVASLPIDAGHLVVDVGGGLGELLTTVLRKHPSCRGVLFDLPAGVAGARDAIRRSGVADRCQVMSGDFFEGVPPGGDVYLLKSVLHNWHDDGCVRVLANCVNAMRAGATVIAMERLMPDRPGAGDRAVVRSDLNMLVALTGRERSAAEFAAVFERAGMRVSRAIRTRCDFALICGVAA